MRNPDRGPGVAPGFTLNELLVVILIILLVSAVALPTVLPAIRHRQVSEAARLLQGSLAGARDQAIHDGQPSGIRLLPDAAFPIQRMANGQIDPTQPLVYSRIVPIAIPPAHNTGRVSVYPTSNYSALPGVNTASGESVLVLEECPIDPATGLRNEPTSWGWNIRVGDRMRLGNQEYTIVGPTFQGPAKGNVEQFVNFDPANRPIRGTGPGAIPITWEYLYLVNGIDDDKDGIVDNGHNGLP